MMHARLLDIAVREFGSKGADGVSTRGIAAAAGTVMSSITYHYGGKEGLYLAAADHVAAQMTAALGDTLAVSQNVAGDDRAAARVAIHRVLARLAAIMLGEGTDDWTLFILREQMRPTEAFERLFAGGMGQLVDTLAGLVGIATGSPETRTAQIATVTLVGQVTALRSARATTLRLLGHDRLTERDAVDFSARIAANTDAILDRLIAERQGTP